MGYTHRYTLEKRCDMKVADIGADIKKLIEASDVPIVDGWGEPGTSPEINDERIFFNGQGDDSYETFVYPLDFDWQDEHNLSYTGFTKTEYRPYDEVVAAAHIVIKHHLGPDVEMYSDGDFDEPQWQQAIKLYQQTFPDRDVGKIVGRKNVPSEGDDNVPYEGIDPTVQAALTAATASPRPPSAASEAKCGKTVKSTGLPCVWPAGHKGNKCRSVP